MHADKARDFTGKGHPGREQEGEGAGRTALPRGSQSWVWVMGLVSSLSLAHQSDSGPSWLCVHLSAKMDSSEEDSGRLVRHVDWPLLSF